MAHARVHLFLHCQPLNLCVIISAYHQLKREYLSAQSFSSDSLCSLFSVLCSLRIVAISLDGEEQGVARIKSALAAHLWPGHRRKEQGLAPPPSELTPGTNDCEELQLHTCSSHSSSLTFITASPCTFLLNCGSKSVQQRCCSEGMAKEKPFL